MRLPPRRRLFGYTAIILGLALFLGERSWLSTRNWWPLDVPISLQSGVIQTAPFTVDLPDAHNIDLFLDDGLMSERGKQAKLDCWACCSYSGPQHLKTHWQLMKEGKVVKSGYSETRYLGFFAGEGTYTLSIEVLSQSPCWQLGDPHLFVSANADYRQFHERMILLAALLVVTGVGCLVGSAALFLVKDYAPGDGVRTGDGFEHQSIEERRRLRLPLRKRLSALPDRSAIAASTVMLAMILLYVANRPPISRGIYISTNVRDYTRAKTMPEDPIIVRVSRQGTSARFVLNGHEVPSEQLKASLKAELSRRPEWVVFVEGDPALPLQDVVTVMDIVTGLHARPVMLTSGMKHEIQ